ncbi:flagellin [Agrobacterium tumefaciens]|uniref:Flagellin n=1 Tax=Agrobacterium tumefaciens TaxID=358 RepID=A0A176X999_AGRTU|nr:flagellin [Agrobacterium tumefaciens]OAE43685.1 flagellin [Agrobacterium tumefaciens]QTK79648.1 flagellin [Agrobacterium tumefaciens]
MASILTNASAMSALQTLRSISSDMSTTQDRISTGMRVGAAKDNAAYWSIATTMRSDKGAISAAQDALGLGAAKVDTAYAGMDAAIKVVTEIKSKLVTATEQGVDKAKVQEELNQLNLQLASVANGASFNGENWLVGTAGAKTVVSGFVRDTAGVKVTTASYTTAPLFDSVDPATGAGTGGLLANTIAINVSTSTDLAADLTTVETALKAMQTSASNLGSISARIDLQQSFADKLGDALEKGIGRLVDADMNEESTKLKALQTQQQLAIQALSIANSDSQSILSLFR